MSKRRLPIDAEATDYVMSAPLDVAATFVRQLTNIVTSRARQAQASAPATSTKRDKPDKPAMARATTTSSTRSRAALKEVKVTDPNQPGEATTAGAQEDAQPTKSEGQLALT